MPCTLKQAFLLSVRGKRLHGTRAFSETVTYGGTSDSVTEMPVVHRTHMMCWVYVLDE